MADKTPITEEESEEIERFMLKLYNNPRLLIRLVDLIWKVAKDDGIEKGRRMERERILTNLWIFARRKSDRFRATMWPQIKAVIVGQALKGEADEV